MKRNSLILALVCVIGLGSFATAFTNDVEGYTWGDYSNPQGFWWDLYSINNGNPTSTFAWGSICSGDSLLKFEGKDIAKNFVNCETDFKAGKLTFVNNSNIYDWFGNSGTVDLTVSLHLNNPNAPDNPYEFDFNLGVFDVVCASDNVTISLPDPEGEVEFTVDDTKYFVSMTGFFDCDGTQVYELSAREPGCHTYCDYAYLYGNIRCEEIDTPSEVIPEPATCLLLGIGIIPLAIRQWKKRK